MPEQGYPELVELVKRFEGLHKVVRRDPVAVQAYKCPAGVWTIGWGTTKGVKEGMVWSLDQCEAALHRDLEAAVASAKRISPNLTGSRLMAIADFIYNLGAGNYQSSTLRRKIQHEEWDEVPEQLRRWVFAKGKKLPGLVLRREAEVILFEQEES